MTKEDIEETKTDKPNNALKPCPFCGGYAKLRTANRTIIKGETVRNCYVYCKTCDARGTRFLEGNTPETHTKARQNAINAWNNRTSDI